MMTLGEAAGELPAGTLEALSGVTTATLTMQLLKRGIRRSWLEGPRSLHPPGHPAAARLVGEAFTLRFLPLREDLGTLDSYARDGSLRDAIEAMPPDRIAVVETRRSPDSAPLGDILVARIKALGGLGIISDGPLRDVAAVRALDFPVYCAGATAPPSIAGLVFAGWQQAIGCGGVTVLPGDVMVADEDGAVVIPRALAAEVATDGLEQERFEAWVQMRVEQGAAVKGLYPPDEASLRDYEAWKQAQSS